MIPQVLVVTEHSDIAETEQFIGLSKKNINLEILSPSTSQYFNHLKGNNVKVTDFTLQGRFDWSGIKFIRQKLIDNQINILHVFNNKATSNGLFASKGLPVKVIAYRGIVGNVSFLDPASWTTYLHPRITRLVCVAEAIRQYFLKLRLFGLKIPPHKVVTIYKGHDLSWYQEKAVDLRQFNIPPGSFTVGTVANIRPRKGIKVFVEAFKYLAHLPDLHFLLVGKMNDASLLKKIVSSGGRERIHLLGFRQNAPAIMGACDLYVLPSLKREGLPKTVIEAMSYGTPPIVTDSGGSPELIEDGKSGLIIPSGDAKGIALAIIKLKNDPVLRQQMGEYAKIRIKDNFSYKDTIDNTYNLYLEVLEEC